MVSAAASAIEHEEQRVPNPSFEKVSHYFGNNLDTDKPMEKMLLMAVGIEHERNLEQGRVNAIGIPFIADKGPQYWVNQLQVSSDDVPSLVNSALIVLFSKEEFPDKYNLANKLLLKASKQGYWPASFYTAEYDLNKQFLLDDRALPASNQKIESPELLTKFKKMSDRFSQCAQAGFAPCQFRIGFWKASNPTTYQEGVEMLKSAINNALSDHRYSSELKQVISEASKVVLSLDETSIAMPDVQRFYHKLISKM